jgi:hypothetical protein
MPGQRWRRLAAAGAAALVGAVTGVVVLAPSAFAAACDSTSTGVTVVVDFGVLGGGVNVRCADGDPGDGVVALRGAGFNVAGTNRWGDAFVCRINGLPTVATDPCVDTPPTSAYWSYWHASRGGSWRYSSSGAREYNPAVGTVEGWSFGAGNQPGLAPPAPPVEPPPPVIPPAGGGSGGGSGGGTTSGAGTDPPDASASADPSPSASGSADPSPSASGSSTTRSTSPASIVDVAAGVSAGLGLTGTLVGVGLVLLLGAAATVIAIRRRLSARLPGGDQPS